LSANPTQQDVESIVKNWPETSRGASSTVMKNYGVPDEASDAMLIWHGNGPWKRTVLWREENPHEFPQPHNDVLQQTIDYKVPLEKYSDLARFDGSVIVERTKGELSARCEGEEMNFLAINLANDICTGALSVEQARQKYTEIAAAFNQGRKDPYVQGLEFQIPDEPTADPDEMTVGETMMHKIKEKIGLEG